MKKYLKTLSVTIFASALLFAFIPPKHSIVGRWKTYGKDGAYGYVYFNRQGAFKVVSSDGKLAHHGNYKFKDDVFSINDMEGCGDTYWGKYKISFISEDSIRFSLIEDSCSGRRHDISTGNVGLRRVRIK